MDSGKCSIVDLIVKCSRICMSNRNYIALNTQVITTAIWFYVDNYENLSIYPKHIQCI